jgi:hypothetical protein
MPTSRFSWSRHRKISARHCKELESNFLKYPEYRMPPFSSESDRFSYAYDAAVLDPVLPGLVVRPESREALGRVVKLCNDNGLPLTVRGSGTNLSGGTIPSKGGVVILTNGMNKILEINEEDLYAVVEPGAVTAKFAAEVAKRGLFYPPDPGLSGRVHPGRQRGRECRRPARPEVRRDQGLCHGRGISGTPKASTSSPAERPSSA